MTTYQNYHKHSYYSNLSTPDSVTSYEDYAKRAVELGHKILSSVEHGNQGRYIECYELAKQYDLKFLFGTEAYFVKDRKEKDGTNAHLVLLARNENGRQWINEILSEANISGFYRHARIDRELLYSIPKNDIWITSACVAGVWKYESYEELLCEMHQYFGDNFFLEVQSHNTIPQRNINQEIIRLKNKYGMNIIAGVDSHYIFNDKAWERDDFLLSRGISYEDENGWYMDYPDDITLIKRFEEQGILTKSEIEESIENTNRFLDVEEYHNEIFEKNIKMPTIYPDKTQEEKNQIFEDLIWKLWEEQKYEVPKEKWDLYEREIKMEIGVVKDINHADYFLMDYAIVQDGITHGGWITNTGRGCFTEDAIVHTDKSLKKIKDVNIGDMVITESGEFHKVLNKYQYDIDEEMVIINYMYGNSKYFPNICTKDHKILIKEQDGNIEWKRADSICNDDCVCVPKIKNNNNEIIVDIAKYNNTFPYDDNFIYEKKVYGKVYQYSPSFMSKLSNYGKSVWEKCANRECYNFEKNTVNEINRCLHEFTPFKNIEEYQNYIDSMRIMKIQRFIKLDYLTNFIIGMLYGDGYVTKRGIALAINSKTKVRNKEIFIKWAYRIGITDKHIYINKSKTRDLEQICINSIVLRDFVSSFLFKSKKGVCKDFNPLLFNQKKESIKGIIDGLFITDGHKCKNENIISFDNTSLSLINAYKIISLMFDSPYSILKRESHKDSRNENWISKDSYKLKRSLTKSKRNSRYNIEDNESFYFLPVWKISILPKQKTTVYDLEIENEHSYLINNMIVHNSAVSFFINKLLGFTKVDRISSDVKLYPERFLSKTRILQTGSIADIDLNLGNPEVFKASQERILGENHAKEMIAYGTYKPKSAWKLFAKSQDVPFDVANAVTRQIEKYEKDLKEADAEERDYINIEDYIDKEYQEIFEKSKNYRGIVSSVSPHACASLIYNKNIRRNIGLIKLRSKQGKEEHICALMDGKWAEKYKFLKNDLLKVSVVALIKELYKRIGIKEHTVSELLAECTPDHKVWDVYKNGWTLGINQVEQAGTSARVMKYKPTNISELCSFVAAIRPGFKSMYKKYENREDFAYNIKTIDDLIRTPQFPQSYMLYQEQAMAVLNYAGIPMDLTYAVVKNIAKKREDEVKKYKDTFLDGMKKRIIEQEHKSQQEAEEIAHMTWQIIEDSTRYSFNACISKDTKIKVNKNGKDFVMTVDELYRELDLDYYAYSLFEDNKIRLNKIVDIRYAGYRQTYLIITKNGKKIYATSNHKFPTVFNGVKKLEDLTTEDYLYIMGDELDKYTYNSYIDKIESISLYKEEDVYDVEMEAPNHNFVIDNGIVTCNSHSLSVAIDSLYCAYLKVMYPLEFYETYIKIMTRENKKDKIILAQNEATTAFGIRTAPFKFREDNRGIKANKERNEISSSLATIKRFGKGISEELYGLKDFNGKYFCDLLKELQKTTLKSNQLEILILLDYFEEFGNSKELLEIVDTYNLLKGGEVKQISIENVQKPFLLEILPKFATDKGINGNQLKSFRVFDGNGLLHACEDYIKSMEVPDFNDSEKVKIKMEYLGYIMPTGKDSDRPKIYINKMYPIYRRDNKKLCGYNFIATSIGSAKQSRYLIWDNVFKKNGSFNEGDIIKLCGFKKNGQSFEVTDYFLLTK